MSRRTAIALPLALWTALTAWNWVRFDPRAEAIASYAPRFVALPRPEVARLGSLGFRSVLADLYWIGAVNYFGDQRNELVSYRQLPNYFNLIVALDPDFQYPYLFGGMAMPWNIGKGWANVDEAISLLERGVRRFPDDWRLHFQLAYTYATYRERYRDAGDQLAAAAALPGVPEYVGRLATRMYASGGQYEMATLVAEQLARSIDNEAVREGLLRRAKELRTVRKVLALEAAVKRFAEVHQRRPASLDELVSSGLLTALPTDELGGTFEYDPSTGSVESSRLHERLKIFK